MSGNMLIRERTPLPGRYKEELTKRLSDCIRIQKRQRVNAFTPPQQQLKQDRTVREELAEPW
jgi:hypothetical protein